MARQVSLDTTGLFQTFEHPSIVTSHVEYTTNALGFKTGETTYGSGLFATRIATELIIEYRYALPMLGTPVDGPALMLRDNNSVILNTTVPSSTLKKKHNALAYHRIREAIAGGIMRFAHIASVENFADILTKPLANAAFHSLVKPLLFRQPTWKDRKDAVVAE